MVSGSRQSSGQFIQLLSAGAPMRAAEAGSGSQARRMLAGADYDLVIINSPLPDEFGDHLAVHVVENSYSGVILIVKSELADDVAQKVEEHGVFVVPKPVSRAFFYQALKLVEASRRRMLGLRTENLRLQDKVEEIRFVNRAKFVLMERLNMTEQQAHRYIEKQAMDMRLTRREVAQGILSTYDN